MTESKTLTYPELVADTLKEIRENKIPSRHTEVLNLMETLITELKGEGITGKSFEMYTADELSRIGGRIAILKHDLGDQVIPQAETNVELAKHYLELRRVSVRFPVVNKLEEAAVKNNTKVRADDIKGEIEKQVLKHALEVVFCQEHFRRCKNRWESAGAILRQIENRCFMLTKGYAESKFFDDAGNGAGADFSSAVPPKPPVSSM